jgi:hypothetical protein
MVTEYIQAKGKVNIIGWAHDKIHSKGHIVAVNETDTTYESSIYWECADLPEDMK